MRLILDVNKHTDCLRISAYYMLTLNGLIVFETMKKQLFILSISILCMFSCNEKEIKPSDYFEPVGEEGYFAPIGIVDKTDEFLNAKKWVTLRDRERIDEYTRIGDSIFGGEIACNIKPLKGIDMPSFEVCAGTRYAKDEKLVYYPIRITCVDFVDCGVCFLVEYIVEGADPKTFEYLSKDYAKDNKSVYFRGEKIKRADSKTFEVINGPEFFYFAKDKNNVYKHSAVFEDADAASFIYDSNDPRNELRDILPKYIIKDKNNTWEYTPPDQIRRVE